MRSYGEMRSVALFNCSGVFAPESKGEKLRRSEAPSYNQFSRIASARAHLSRRTGAKKHTQANSGFHPLNKYFSGCNADARCKVLNPSSAETKIDARVLSREECGRRRWGDG